MVYCCLPALFVSVLPFECQTKPEAIHNCYIVITDMYNF